MSRWSLILYILGGLALLVAIAGITLDALGRGDGPPFDPRDLAILVVGVILVGVAVGLGRLPPRPTPSPPPA